LTPRYAGLDRRARRGGGPLAGSGTIGSFTSIAGIHLPGRSPGLQTFESGLTDGSSSTLVWELSANTNLIADRGVLYDGIDLTGGALSIESGASLSLVFDAPLFDATSSKVNFFDSFWGQGRNWTIIALSGGATSSGNLFMIDAVGTDANNVALATAQPNAQFFLSQAGSDLVLNYSIIVVPEPGGLALAALGLAARVAAHLPELAPLRRARLDVAWRPTSFELRKPLPPVWPGRPTCCPDGSRGYIASRRRTPTRRRSSPTTPARLSCRSRRCGSATS